MGALVKTALVANLEKRAKTTRSISFMPKQPKHRVKRVSSAKKRSEKHETKIKGVLNRASGGQQNMNDQRTILPELSVLLRQLGGSVVRQLKHRLLRNCVYLLLASSVCITAIWPGTPIPNAPLIPLPGTRPPRRPLVSPWPGTDDAKEELLGAGEGCC